MGIDVTLSWVGQSLKEKDAQYGHDLEAGRRGFLREPYHGGPYVTRYLVSEAFDSDIAMPAALLRKRLPFAVLLATYREHVVYSEGEPSNRLDLSTTKREDFAETVMAFMDKIGAEVEQSRAPLRDIQPTPSQLEAAEALIAKRQLSPRALSFLDFVELAERKEAETGGPCVVSVSW